MTGALACAAATSAICTHRAKGQHPTALFPWREHEWARPSRGDGFSLGPRTYGATRPVWHCGLPATVRKLPGTQIGACIIELMRVSIRHHLHSVWNPRAARAIQVYRQRKRKQREHLNEIWRPWADAGCAMRHLRGPVRIRPPPNARLGEPTKRPGGGRQPRRQPI